MLNIYKYIPLLSPMYNEVHRHYHSIKHVHNLTNMITTKSYLEKISPHKALLYSNTSRHTPNGFEVDGQLMLLAWFHDCYYDPYLGSPGNEKISGNIFSAMTSGDVHSQDDQSLFFEVLSGIQLSGRHLSDVSEPTSPSGRPSLTNLIFMDLDMNGFSDNLEFTLNNTLVRAEYYKSSPLDYLKGRIKFLETLLEKKQIYYTFDDVYEDRARKNIEESLVAGRKLLDDSNGSSY